MVILRFIRKTITFFGIPNGTIVGQSDGDLVNRALGVRAVNWPRKLASKVKVMSNLKFFSMSSVASIEISDSISSPE